MRFKFITFIHNSFYIADQTHLMESCKIQHSLIRLAMMIGSSMCTEVYLEKNKDCTVLAIIVLALVVWTNSTTGMNASWFTNVKYVGKERVYLKSPICLC